MNFSTQFLTVSDASWWAPARDVLLIGKFHDSILPSDSIASYAGFMLLEGQQFVYYARVVQHEGKNVLLKRLWIVPNEDHAENLMEKYRARQERGHEMPPNINLNVDLRKLFYEMIYDGSDGMKYMDGYAEMQMPLETYNRAGILRQVMDADFLTDQHVNDIAHAMVSGSEIDDSPLSRKFRNAMGAA